ncbi:F-box protein [Ceratobasidium sp. AG-Ba]|nr:F-box protein [Ceratobasidium sp. AG-Ba]
MGNMNSASSPWSLADSSGLPATLVRETIRAARVDRRWSAARPFAVAGYPSPDDATWTYVKLAAGLWILCTDERGDVTAMHLAKAIRTSAQRAKDGIVYESSFDPYCSWSGPVGWFPGPALLIAQLKSDFRSLIIRTCSLPPADHSSAPSATNQISQCKLNLGAISVLALQVNAVRRCLLVLYKDLGHEARFAFLSVWRWSPNEDVMEHPPKHVMRTAPFEVREPRSCHRVGVLIEPVFSYSRGRDDQIGQAKDCEFCVAEYIGGPHVLVVRASENATHFEFYDFPAGDDIPEPALIEPEPRMPIVGLSIPLECHHITLPQSSWTGAGAVHAITVLLCTARSMRHTELLAYRVAFDGRSASLSFMGGNSLPEYADLIDCVLGERGVRGVASIAAPRRDTRVTLALLTCDGTFRSSMLEHPIFDLHQPMRLAFDEIRATVAFLDSESDVHIVLFDSDLHYELERA